MISAEFLWGDVPYPHRGNPFNDMKGRRDV
jgi:hypothetical protein